MALWDFVSGAIEAVGFDDIVGDFLGNIGLDFGSPLFNDVFSGAITNAAVSAIGGGDIGKAALFGAVGGGFGDGGMLGDWGNELGGAISGYGMAESFGGDGWKGALAGGVGARMGEKRAGADAGGGAGGGGGGGKTTNYGKDGSSTTTVNQSSSGSTGGTDGGGFMDKLKSMGLMDKDGKATFLGEAALATGMGLGQKMMDDDKLEQEQEMWKDRAQTEADIIREEEQKRIGYFTNKKNPYRINRSQ